MGLERNIMTDDIEYPGPYFGEYDDWYNPMPGAYPYEVTDSLQQESPNARHPADWPYSTARIPGPTA
jgi:hypothetical protein